MGRSSERLLACNFLFSFDWPPGRGEFRSPRTGIEVARVRSAVSALRERTFMLRIEMLHQ